MRLDTATDSILRDVLIAGSQMMEDGETVVVDLYGGSGQIADSEGVWSPSEPVLGSLTMRMASKPGAITAHARLTLWALTDRPVVLVVSSAQHQLWLVDPASGETICLGA